MGNVAKVREILKTINFLAPFLDDQGISDIALVLLKAMQRLEKENGGN